VASTGPSGPATISDQEYKFRPAARSQHAQHAEHTPSRVVHFRDDGHRSISCTGMLFRQTENGSPSVLDEEKTDVLLATVLGVGTCCVGRSPLPAGWVQSNRFHPVLALPALSACPPAPSTPFPYSLAPCSVFPPAVFPTAVCAPALCAHAVCPPAAWPPAFRFPAPFPRAPRLPARGCCSPHRSDLLSTPLLCRSPCHWQEQKRRRQHLCWRTRWGAVATESALRVAKPHRGITL